MRPEAEVRAARDLLALDRRGFLRLAGAATAAGLLPAGCGAPAAPWAPPRDLALRALTPRTYAVLGAATERVVGEPGAALVRSGGIRPGAEVDPFLARSPALAEPLNQALLVLEFGFAPLLGKLRPFTALDAAGRDAILAELMGSRLALKRLLFKGVKSVALLAVYGTTAGRQIASIPARPGPPGVSIEDAMRTPRGR